MYKHQKEIWIQLLQLYKESTLLWDPKHKDYANQPLRNKAYEKLLEVHKKIDSKGTVSHMKKKLFNLRTTYFKERKKKLKYMENGEDYTPTLWYYKHLDFLSGKKIQLKRNHVEDGRVYTFNRSDNTIYLEKQSPNSKSVKRIRPNVNSCKSSLRNNSNQTINIEENSSGVTDEEDNRETDTSPQASMNEIYNLIKRQTNLIDGASRLLMKKEKNWEVVGKAIGVQLYNLDEKQRHIAHKLISDVIFYGGQGRLTTESIVNVDGYAQEISDSSVIIKEQIEYLEPEYLENE